MFALYEFEDQSVEVGPVEWIKDPSTASTSPSPSSSAKELNRLKSLLVNKKVTVCWPSTSSTKSCAAGGGKKTKSFADFPALVLAVNESKLKLIEKRNKLCEGLSMETDVETGRGKRRKVPKRISTSSSSESEDNQDSDNEQASKVKKHRAGNTFDEYIQKAKGLRKKLLEDEPHEESDCLMDISDDEEKEDSTCKRCMELQAEKQKNKELVKALAKEKAAKEQLQQNLLLLQGLPSFIKSFRGFMTDMKTLTMKNQTPAQKPNQPVDQADPEAVRDPEADRNNDYVPDAMVALALNVNVHKAVLARCNASNYKKLTSDLMVALFGRDTLVKSSLTGAKNLKGVSKPALDREKVEAIISYVQTKFGTSTCEVRQVMTTKLNNEVKLQKRRAVGPNGQDHDPLQ